MNDKKWDDQPLPLLTISKKLGNRRAGSLFFGSDRHAPGAMDEAARIEPEVLQRDGL